MSKQIIDNSILVVAARNSLLCRTAVSVAMVFSLVLNQLDRVLGDYWKASKLDSVIRVILERTSVFFKGSDFITILVYTVLTTMFFLKKNLIRVFCNVYRGSEFIRITGIAATNSRTLKGLLNE